jgi:hypothetical protein
VSDAEPDTATEVALHPAGSHGHAWTLTEDLDLLATVDLGNKSFAWVGAGLQELFPGRSARAWQDSPLETSCALVRRAEVCTTEAGRPHQVSLSVKSYPSCNLRAFCVL